MRSVEAPSPAASLGAPLHRRGRRALQRGKRVKEWALETVYQREYGSSPRPTPHLGYSPPPTQNFVQPGIVRRLCKILTVTCTVQQRRLHRHTCAGETGTRLPGNAGSTIL